LQQVFLSSAYILDSFFINASEAVAFEGAKKSSSSFSLSNAFVPIWLQLSSHLLTSTFYIREVGLKMGI
jgi:hypothetical protein